MKIDFNTLEEYYKTLQYLEYEYTNNLIYEFFKRTLDHSDKIGNYEYKPIISYTLTLKDVILFENSEIRFTLQDIIYNSCNEFYEECINDQKIKDKLNFSINITDFLAWFKDKKDKDKELLKPVIYKDLNLNKFIKITEDEILKKIDETLTYKKINIRYSKKQLNIKENNFVTIYDLNLNLPETEILEYIKLLKQKHRTLKYDTNSKHPLNELSENEIDNIKTFILYMSKPENQNKSNASINFFKNLSSIKYNQQLKQQIDITEEYYNKYILSKNESIEKIKYKSYIYDRNKLFYILFIYDCMKLKTETETDSYDLMMKKIQILILSYRRMELELFDYDDFKKYKIDEKNYNKFQKLIQILVNDLKLNIIDRTDNLTTQDIKNSIRNINTENIENIKKSIENINKFLSKNNMKMFTEFPYLSIRTLYKYYSIAKFYIDEGNYKLLLEQ